MPGHPFQEVPLDDDPAFRRTVYELGVASPCHS
jgi:hypothetical protein